LSGIKNNYSSFAAACSIDRKAELDVNPSAAEIEGSRASNPKLYGGETCSRRIPGRFFKGLKIKPLLT
jgi:hypothetical protein